MSRFHVEPLSLSSEGRFPPLFECCGVIVLVNSFIEAFWKTFGEMPDGEWVIDIEMRVADKLFKLCDIAIGVEGIHLDAFHDEGSCLFFLQNVGVLSSK